MPDSMTFTPGISEIAPMTGTHTSGHINLDLLPLTEIPNSNLFSIESKSMAVPDVKTFSHSIHVLSH